LQGYFGSDYHKREPPAPPHGHLGISSFYPGHRAFISTILKTQQQSLLATMFFNMPAMLLSGFMFPIENMPVIFQYITYLNPLRYSS